MQRRGERSPHAQRRDRKGSLEWRLLRIRILMSANCLRLAVRQRASAVSIAHLPCGEVLVLVSS